MSPPDQTLAKDARATSARLNHWVFWPPFLLLLVAIALNFLAPDVKDELGKVTQKGAFSATVGGANRFVLDYFGWLFSLCAALAVSTCTLICFSRFRHVRIGGSDAQPLLSKWNWFSITICTTIAIGILFWSTAEPIAHFCDPPAVLGVAPCSPQAATFAMSTMYLHWSFTPYAIYCTASLMFAFAYYNMKEPFSLGSTLAPLLGKRAHGTASHVIDAVCLYALVAGMAAALGAGILMLGSGLNDLFGIPSNELTWALITLAIVATFVISSATGLMNGIRVLSSINTKLLLGLIFVPVLFGGANLFLLQLGGTSLMDYLLYFVPRNLAIQQAGGDWTVLQPDQWGKSWTVFYWAVWLAWAPVTACFLGRIAYGRTVSEFLRINLLYPSLFGIVWMTVFGGTAIHLQLQYLADPQTGVDLLSVKEASGEAAVSFAVFKELPFSTALIAFYMFSAFVCFVTSSDSNMSAMSSISSTGISPENPEGNSLLKIVWGVTVGVVAWIMICFTGGVEGVKMLSNLGGFPAAFLELMIIASLLRVVWNHRQLDRTKHSVSDSSKVI